FARGILRWIRGVFRGVSIEDGDMGEEGDHVHGHDHQPQPEAGEARDDEAEADRAGAASFAVVWFLFGDDVRNCPFVVVLIVASEFRRAKLL
ncbi:hypothetical protein PFISCL1PPCAC_7765, partial [Pristionchus fissidentatus]